MLKPCITINAPTAAPVTLDKVKAAKKKMTVTFTPEDPSIPVEIAYSMDENFSDDNTTITEVKAGKKKAVIKKLKSKKTYCFPVSPKPLSYRISVP